MAALEVYAVEIRQEEVMRRCYPFVDGIRLRG